ncbi:hypothetical protein NHH03_24785 [Stieleria sp. TO1_6]|uniref:hypothetical protein n=1 Tax=Stieleria tagensis TaxID=2956795 RepID=UPI00209A6C61|nr:hypothetical protein [Stieleria tagensis]MCO8124976.1 hypothetical protein [Stieleria tagensis]
MVDPTSSVEGAVDELKRQRDELKLKIHLGGMEANQEYERLSDKVFELEQQLSPVKEAAEYSAEQVAAALQLAAGEMLAGFDRVRKAIKESS